MDTMKKLEQENKLLRAQNGELLESLRRQFHVFKEIEAFSSKLGSFHELTLIYKNCLQLFKDLLSLDFATLLLAGDDPGILMVNETIGFDGDLVGSFTVCRGVGLPGIVMESEHVEVIEDFQTEKRTSIPEVIFQNEITSAIAVPMMHDKKLFGVFVGHTVKKRVFTEEDRSLAQILANQSATAIKNAIHIQSLHDSEQKNVERTAEFETIFSNSMTGFMLLRGGRTLARCNQRMADLLEYDSPEVMQGMNMRQLHLTPERFEEFGKKYYDALAYGEPVTVEYQLRKNDGEPVWCILSGKAIDSSSSPDLTKGVVWGVDDISRRKLMEEQILKHQKLQSIEILTGGLAHDFNNIITAILGNISMSMASIDEADPAYSFLLPAKEASLRAKELTQKLQHFSRESSPACSLSSLADIVTDSVNSTILDEQISIEYQFDKDLWLAEVDFEQIRKALSHLLENSQQAMPKGGVIYISCHNFRNEGDVAGLSAEYYVQVKVSDTGYGIPTEIIDKIFDPYFTTKARDSKQGSGLGLATVHSVVKRHKGLITVASVESCGATFTMYLPASPGKKAVAKNVVPEQEGEAVVSRKGSVLVMDDDESVLDIIDQMLTLGGYEVELVVNGEEAVRRYSEQLAVATPFDVVILDLNIPGAMGGADAAQEIAVLHKEAKMIASSGDTVDPVMQKFGEYGFVAAIGKPFDFTELLRTIASVTNDT